MARNRYDIRFSQEEEGKLGVWINDKLREYVTIRGFIPTNVTAEHANSFKNDLTDAMRHLSVQWHEIPAFLERWLNFLEENRQKEFTDGSNE